jgi:hypothetical protein
MTDLSADQVAAMQTVTRMFTTADAKDFDAYRGQLADELTVDFGGVNETGGAHDAAGGWVTGDEMRASAETVVGPVETTQHMLSDMIAEVDGDTAIVTFSEAGLHVHHALGDDPAVSSWIVYGRGEQRLRRTPDGWRIVHAGLIPTHHEGNPNLLADVAALRA